MVLLVIEASVFPPSNTPAFPTHVNVTLDASVATLFKQHSTADVAEVSLATPVAEANTIDENKGMPLINGVYVTDPLVHTLSSVYMYMDDDDDLLQ